MGASEEGGALPVVSVIVPVYNALDYVGMALESALNQGYRGEELEIIVVDDGSTDGSGELLDRFAAEHAEVTVIHQESSGGPGAPRNAGLDIARGRYVFFLDADDELTPGALRDLVEVAERESSEVVLGKMGGLGGRQQPTSMFTATVMDADLVADKAIRTLGPWKLFRRDLLEREAIRFPTEVSKGEDPPFVMHAYLRASKISICSDRVYYLLRYRDDGGNVSRKKVPAEQKLAHFTTLTEVILRHTDPGALRDAVLWRPLTYNVPTLLGTGFLGWTADEQTLVVEGIRRLLGPTLTEGAAAHLAGLTATKLRLAVDGEKDLLLRVLEWENANPSRLIELGSDGARLALPEDLAAEIGPARIVDPVIDLDLQLTRSAAQDGQVEFGARVVIPGSSSPVAVAVLEFEQRKSGHVIEVPTRIVASEVTDKAVATHVTAVVDMGSLSRGIWDVYLAIPDHGTRMRKRLGRRRSAAVPKQLTVVEGAHGAEAPVACTYFTEGQGDVSLDVGLTMKKHQRPQARIRGVLGQGARRTAIIEVRATGANALAVETREGERVAVPSERLSGSLILADLPAELELGGAGIRPPLWVTDTLGEAKVEVDAGVHVITQGEQPAPSGPETGEAPRRDGRRRRIFGGSSS